jgi:hypothetical protein
MTRVKEHELDEKKSDSGALPLLFAKREPAPAAAVRQYAGTDTERDIKG